MQGLDRTALGQLLISGGDAQLNLNLVKNLNDYGCSSLPRLETLSFASSTASSISQRGYAAVENAVNGLYVGNEFGDF